MTLVRQTAAACFSLIALAAIAVGVAYADTPTPTPAPVSSATPVPPEPALFNIIPWVNGQNAAHDVTAKIGETLCATGVPSAGAGARANYQLLVPSEEVVPGCGREGAVVTFFVDGQQAARTAIWHSGGSGDPSRIMNVVVGTPFARFILIIGGSVPQAFGPDSTLVSFLGDRACGNSEVVYSNEQEPGCGVEGSQIAFKLLDAQGNVIAVANEKATWHAWDGVSEPQQLNLTFGPAARITMLSTGDGPAQATAPWGPLALALASLGLAGGIAALALRRRSITR
jgi:hypothetical protein